MSRSISQESEAVAEVVEAVRWAVSDVDRDIGHFVEALNRHRPWLQQRPEEASRWLAPIVNTASSLGLLHSCVEPMAQALEAVLEAAPHGLFEHPDGGFRHVSLSLMKADEGMNVTPYADAIDRVMRHRPQLREGVNATLDAELAKPAGHKLNMGWVHIALARGWLDGKQTLVLADANFDLTRGFTSPFDRIQTPRSFPYLWVAYHNNTMDLKHVHEDARRAMGRFTDAGLDWGLLRMDDKDPNRGINALHMAISHKMPDLVRDLLAQGADATAPMLLKKANPHENGFDAIDPIRLAEQRLDATPRTPYPLQREALHVIDMLKAAVAKQAAMACLNLIEKGPAP